MKKFTATIKRNGEYERTVKSSTRENLIKGVNSWISYYRKCEPNENYTFEIDKPQAAEETKPAALFNIANKKGEVMFFNCTAEFSEKKIKSLNSNTGLRHLQPFKAIAQG